MSSRGRLDESREFAYGSARYFLRLDYRSTRSLSPAARNLRKMQPPTQPDGSRSAHFLAESIALTGHLDDMEPLPQNAQCRANVALFA